MHGNRIQDAPLRADYRAVQDKPVPRTPDVDSRAAVEALTQAMIVWDEDEYGHSTRSADYAARLAAQLGIAPAEAEHIRLGALLHDIGKIGLDLSVLRKPGKLDAAETDIVRLHPSMGASILGRVLPASIVECASAHHEQPDGKGYPNGLRDGDIPVGAAICRVADVLDSLTTAQSYRPAMSLEEAVEELQTGAGTRYSARVVGALIAYLGDHRSLDAA